MSFLHRLLITFTLIACLATPLGAEEQSLEDYAARAAAEYFLVLLDQGEYTQCWESTSELFRTSSIKLQWEERIGHLRDQYGKLHSRQLRYSKQMQDAEGAPKGAYFFMIYGSSFAAKDSAIETITVMKETDGKWRVSGYSLK